MCIRKSHRVLLISLLILLLGALLVSTLACEPSFDLTVENQTAQKLTIYVDGVLIGTAEPGQQVTAKNFPGVSIKYLIVAKNEQGETVFSESFGSQQMRDVKGANIYKVVIPPPPE